MKLLLPILLLLVGLWSAKATAQCDTNRYRQPIFNSVYKHQDVKYGEAQVWNIPYNNTDLYMDVYEPIGDAQTKRPLMIWVHPGGFLAGDKSADDMVALCDSFARRGYVTASIGYRLGFNPVSSSSAERAVYRGTQDLRAAIRYLFEFADVFDIDTNYLFVGGSSAGAFSTLHMTYLDQDEAPSAVYGGFGSPDLGCLDCSGNTYNHVIKPTAIVGLWGALGDSTWVDSDETTPNLMIHGDADGVVPFGVGHPFGVFTTPEVNGSRTIHNQLNSYGISNQLIQFVGQDHEPHGADNGTFNSPPNAYWDTIFDAIQNHYLPFVIPNSSNLFGPTEVCSKDTSIYSVFTYPNQSVCWTVTGGTIIDDLGDSIVVEWNGVAGSVDFQIVNSIGGHSTTNSNSIVINALPIISGFDYSVSDNNSFFEVDNPNSNTINWDFGDGSTATGDSVMHNYSNEGIYQVTMTSINSNGCSSSYDTLIYFQFTDLSELFNDNLVVYPNPFDSYISLKGLEDNVAEVNVIDQIGKLVGSYKIKGGEKIDLFDLKSGVYLVEIQLNDTKIMKRIIKN